MPNPHRERFLPTNSSPAQDGICHRRRLMWSGTNYDEVFTFVCPAFSSAYHHQVDTVGFQRNYFNPCWHLHTILPSKGIKVLHTNAGRTSLGPGYGELEFPGAGLISEKVVEYAFARIGEFGDLPPWLDDFSAKAEYHFKTAVKPKWSIANLIIEILQMLQGNFGKLKSIYEKVIAALKAFRKMYEKTGNYWLAWNFCIKPTLRDLKSLMKSMKDADKRLKWLQKHNREDIIVKYREKEKEWEFERLDFPIEELRYVGSDFDPFTGFLYPQAAWSMRDVKISCSPSAHALVRFDIPDELLSADLGTGLGWMLISGLYNPLEIAWEAIPYSWLVDWFLSERAKLLRRLADLSPFPDAEVKQTMHSLKWTIDFEFGYVDTPGSKDINYVPHEPEEPTEEFHALGAGRIKLYRRVPELPMMESSVFRVPLEWYNLSILAALLAQKRRR